MFKEEYDSKLRSAEESYLLGNCAFLLPTVV